MPNDVKQRIVFSIILFVIGAGAFFFGSGLIPNNIEGNFRLFIQVLVVGALLVIGTPIYNKIWEK